MILTELPDEVLALLPTRRADKSALSCVCRAFGGLLARWRVARAAAAAGRRRVASRAAAALRDEFGYDAKALSAINAPSRFWGRTPLVKAIDNGREAEARALLALGADVAAPEIARHGRGETVLHCAAHAGLGSLVLELARAGARVNASTNYGDTPLHWAASCADGDLAVDTAHALLAAGADVNARNSAGVTPLQRALDTESAVLALFLHSYGGEYDDAAAARPAPPPRL